MSAAKASWSLGVEGGCHCGAVRFRATLREPRALRCNCSVCAKRGFVHLIVSHSDFQLLRGAKALSSYRFNTRVAEHLFCSTCGVQSFYRPRSHPEDFSVNLNCLDAGPGTATIEVVEFDGHNWEAAVQGLRHGS